MFLEDWNADGERTPCQSLYHFSIFKNNNKAKLTLNEFFVFVKLEIEEMRTNKSQR